MSIFSWFQAEAKIVETDVLAFITKVENDVAVVVKDAEAALSWLAAEAPTVAADVAQVATFIEGIPVVGANPTVLAAVTAANVAVQGLNAFAAAYTKSTATGGSITLTQASQAVVAGYQGLKNAQAAVAAAASTAVSATSVASAPGPVPA